MARKALIEAEYLTGGESQDELSAILPDIAADLLTDILHLMGKSGFTRLGQMALLMANEANKNYEADGFML